MKFKAHGTPTALAATAIIAGTGVLGALLTLESIDPVVGSQAASVVPFAEPILEYIHTTLAVLQELL